MMAQDRKIVEEAYAGDIIGVFDPGIFSIGDTLCLSNEKFEYEGIPICAGAFCQSAPDGYHEAEAIYKGRESDRPGRCHPDFSGV